MIVIIYAKLAGGYIESPTDMEPWLCWLEVTREDKTWMLPATAPHSLAEEQLQVYFDEQEDHLWALAEEKQYSLRLCGNVGTTELIRPLMLAVLDELNFIRENPGTHLAIPEEDLVEAIKSYLGGN